MDLNRVAVFVRVVEERGFTAAAKALRLPKSSVSRAVGLLEQELGARLLRRSTRTVSLTEAGTAFYERASRGLSTVYEAREAVVDLESAVRGPIRITVPVDAGVWLFAPYVGAFTEKYPEVHIEVVLTGRVVDLVEEGFDLALRFGELRDQSLVAKKLPPMDFALYASPGYLAKHKAPRRPADLAHHRCVLFRARRGRDTWKLTGANGTVAVDVRGAVSADDLFFVQQAAIGDAGIAFLPSFIAAGTELVRVLPGHSMPGAPMHIVHASGRYMPHRVTVFRDYLVRSLTSAGARE